MKITARANSPNESSAAKQGSYDTRAIDMDADGDLDVLIAGHTSNNVVWLRTSYKPGKLTYMLIKTFLVYTAFKAITLRYLSKYCPMVENTTSSSLSSH